jgi:uncharacterized Zn ribbon protein
MQVTVFFVCPECDHEWEDEFEITSGEAHVFDECPECGELADGDVLDEGSDAALSPF